MPSDTPRLAALTGGRHWCPPTQAHGPHRAVATTLTPDHRSATTEISDYFATPALALRWLQHHIHHIAAHTSPHTPVHAVVETRHSPQTPPARTYDVTGPAHDILDALSLRTRTTSEPALVTGHPDTDTTVLASLLTEYETCCHDLHTGDRTHPGLRAHRATIRRDIGVAVTIGAIDADLAEHTLTRLRSADLDVLAHPTGPFHATALVHQPDPTTPMLQIDRRFTCPRHAREYLLHCLRSHAIDPGGPATVAVTVQDTRTETATPVYRFDGPVTVVVDALSSITDFDGTYLIGIREVDRQLLLALVRDYHAAAAELGSDLERASDTDIDTEAFLARVHAQYQRYREITTMLTEPDLADLTDYILPRLHAADALLASDPS